MSDLKITEFRERAESGLDIPDLAVIERKGRGLRRRRLATAAGGVALVLVTGFGVARVATDVGDAALDPATPPSPTPSTSWDTGVRTSVDLGEEVLVAGRSEVVYDGVRVRFDVPGENWEWWDVGLGLRRSADDPNEYAAAVFFLRDASARLQPCSAGRAQALGANPDALIANVAPLLDLAHATVLQGPRVITAFGGSAVHVRLQTNGACPEGVDLPAQLQGVLDGSATEPGWPGQHVLDVWHVVVPGPKPASMLVASWDLDGTSRNNDRQRALLDSLRIDVN
jgi:hypothetical protein